MNDGADELSEVAPTLEALRKLPKEQKAGLLLARLAKIRRQNFDGLNKHNLLLPGDPYQLAYGYLEAEKIAVKEHLLGAPWTWLVNEGYLVDVAGNGFFKVSDEGSEFLAHQSRATPSPTVTPIPTAATDTPRAFLSYSWEGADHKQWVTKLAERLQSDGIEIIFDRWHLQPGGDKLHFMEQAVTTNDFVIIICTEGYAERANNRQGGVGYESMVITSAMAEDLLSKKFIPILRQGTFTTSLPKYIKTKMGVDFSDEPFSEDEYERLVRVLHGEPLQPPPLGKKPDFSKPLAKSVVNAVVEAAKSATAPSGDDGSLLGPLNKRPNGHAHADYDKPGHPGPWIHAIVRLWDKDGEQKYSFETRAGEESVGEEYWGSKDEIISRFFDFKRKMLKDGYKEMGFSPGPDPDFSVLK